MPSKQHPNNFERSPRAASRAGLAALAPLAGLAGALALTACLTDGPNRTGGEFLERHGLLLETPLHRIEVKDFPVDSFFVGDLDPGRLGDSLILAGRWGNFTSQVRMAFDLADTNHVDSLVTDGTLRLALSFPIPNRGDDELKAMVAGVDSMTFLVESWAFDFQPSDAGRADSLNALNNHFLVRQDTAALFRSDVIHRDTIRVAVKTAYEKAGGRDSIQVFPLPNLLKELQIGLDNGLRWIVLMQLTHIQRDSTDTAAAMLRFGGNHGTQFSPSLLFGGPEGTAKHPVSATNAQKVRPLSLYYQNSLRMGINARYRHAGSPTAMLTGRTRGLHLRLDRAVLLDSLDAALRRLGGSLARASDGQFDLGYYVPFAQLTVPLEAPSEIEGGFPMDMRLVSDLDSLLPTDSLGVERYLVKQEDEVIVLSERNRLTQASDSVVARYEEVVGLPGLYRFILWGKDTTFKDTTFLRDGETKEVLRSATSSGRDRLVFTAKAQGDTLAYRVHVNTQGEEEGYLFKDAATGTPLRDLAQRIPRFLKPQDSSLTLRATYGFQRMLNRARLGQEIHSDFFIQPIRNSAADTASKLVVPYAVLGEIEPEIKAGRIGVDIVIYLYPLKAR